MALPWTSPFSPGFTADQPGAADGGSAGAPGCGRHVHRRAGPVRRGVGRAYLQGEHAALTTGAPVAGPDARASLLGTIKRANSKT